MKVWAKVVLGCWLLNACVMPNYHSYSQKLPLNNLINTQGMSLEQVRGTEIVVDNKPINKSQIVFEDGETLQEKFNKNTLFTPAETTQP